MTNLENNSPFGFKKGILQKINIFESKEEKEKKRRQKHFLKVSSFFNNNLYFGEIPSSKEEENKPNKKESIFDTLNTSKSYSNNNELFDTVFIANILNKQKNLESFKGANSSEIIKESGKKIRFCFSNILNFYESKNYDIKKIKDILEMDEEKIKKITSENIKTIPPKKKHKIIEGTGKCIWIFISIISLLLPLFLMYLLLTTTKIKKEKYESISFFDGEILNKLKASKNITNLGKEILDDLSLRIFKFADLGYKIRSKEEENIFPQAFMNWEIINYKLIGKDNSFYVLKDSKSKKLIVTFPGTNIGSLQILEEILGSSLKNFHKNYSDILISRYFGERISEILNYIYTPEINELLQNNYQIISTGHSLGGAIAQAFIYFSLIEKKINENNSPMTITFNQPRVGNKIFAEFLDKNAFNLRYTKGSDIVSSIPFSNFDFIDICKYIFKKRNIHNEYVHTYNEINITDSIYLPSFINAIIIILAIISLCIFMILIKNRIFLKIMEKHELNISLSFNKKIDIDIFLIVFLSTFLCGFLAYFPIIVALKYKSYLFIIVIILFFVFILLLLLTIIPLLILLIIDILILFYDIYLCILNLSMDSKEKVKFDTEKFKKDTLENKYVIIAALNYLCFGSFATIIANELLDFHSNLTGRTEKEQFYYNGTKLDSMANDLGECNSAQEMAYLFIDKLNEGNKQNIEIVH